MRPAICVRTAQMQFLSTALPCCGHLVMSGPEKLYRVLPDTSVVAAAECRLCSSKLELVVMRSAGNQSELVPIQIRMKKLGRDESPWTNIMGEAAPPECGGDERAI